MRIALALVTLAATLAAQTPAASGSIAIIPLPTTITSGHGDFVLTASTTTSPTRRSERRDGNSPTC